jgi:starch phosphorylase
MDVLYQEKSYSFLIKTDLRFEISVNQQTVWVNVYYLDPKYFNTAPLFLFSTDDPANDYFARCITDRLYDPNPEMRLSASVVLGVGADRLAEAISAHPFVFHLNESHALPLVFSWMSKGLTLSMIRKRLIFTNHTPEPGGNESNPKDLLERIGYTRQVPWDRICNEGVVMQDRLDHTRTAFQFSGFSNGVSQLHTKWLNKNVGDDRESRKWHAITNAQHAMFWADGSMYRAISINDAEAYITCKQAAKRELFEEVVDQTGKWLEKEILTLVFAKRFCNYKRATLLLHDLSRLERLLTDSRYPIQIIWAGKPYPVDYSSIAEFDRLVHFCKSHPRCCILTGYELKLSKMLKRGADVWLNVPRTGHEASGTSGISASMNGAINLSKGEGWYDEFVDDGVNGFLIEKAAEGSTEVEEDRSESSAMYDILERKILPAYYEDKNQWFQLIKNSMSQIRPRFDSDRMVRQYYDELYSKI